MLTELSPESFPRQEERVLPCSVFPGDPLAQPLNHSAGQPRAHAVNVNSLFWQVFKHCLTGIRFIFPSSWPSQPKLCFFSPLLGQLSCCQYLWWAGHCRSVGRGRQGLLQCRFPPNAWEKSHTFMVQSGEIWAGASSQKVLQQWVPISCPLASLVTPSCSVFISHCAIHLFILDYKILRARI